MRFARGLAPKTYEDDTGHWWVRTREIDGDGHPVYTKAQDGPGRPRLPDGVRRRQFGVTLQPAVADQLRRLGKGNLSQGIAIAAARATQDPDRDFL